MHKIFFITIIFALNAYSSDLPVTGQAQPVELINLLGQQAAYGTGNTGTDVPRFLLANDQYILLSTAAKQDIMISGTALTNTKLDTVNTNLTTINTNVVSGTSATVSALNTIRNNQTNATQKTQLVTSTGQNYNFTGVTSTTVALPTQITGDDGLYRARVDSVGRLATNANVTFPEAVYSNINLLNAGSKNMNVNGGTPVTFTYAPTSGTFYVEQVAYFIADNAALTTGGFGALGALTNGVIIEYQSKGVAYTFTNLKDNGDLSNTFSDASFGQINAGLLATDAYLTGSFKLQQRIALDPAFGDYFRARVRDNLTGLTHFTIRLKVWRVN